MNDLISREAAIDEIKKRFCTGCDNYKGIRCMACNFDDATGVIEDMPSAQQWIPCSERSPEKNGEYIVTIKFETSEVKEIYVDKVIYDSEYGFCNYSGFIKDGFEKVVAWCPLPEPYVEVEE